jgi:hypothetical protein
VIGDVQLDDGVRFIDVEHEHTLATLVNHGREAAWNLVVALRSTELRGAKAVRPGRGGPAPRRAGAASA